jgi:hypothetical protein
MGKNTDKTKAAKKKNKNSMFILRTDANAQSEIVNQLRKRSVAGTWVTKRISDVSHLMFGFKGDKEQMNTKVQVFRLKGAASHSLPDMIIDTDHNVWGVTDPTDRRQCDYGLCADTIVTVLDEVDARQTQICDPEKSSDEEMQALVSNAEEDSSEDQSTKRPPTKGGKGKGKGKKPKGAAKPVGAHNTTVLHFKGNKEKGDLESIVLMSGSKYGATHTVGKVVKTLGQDYSHEQKYKAGFQTSDVVRGPNNAVWNAYENGKCMINGGGNNDKFKMVAALVSAHADVKKPIAGWATTRLRNSMSHNRWTQTFGKILALEEQEESMESESSKRRTRPPPPSKSPSVITPTHAMYTRSNSTMSEEGMSAEEMKAAITKALKSPEVAALVKEWAKGEVPKPLGKKVKKVDLSTEFGVSEAHDVIDELLALNNGGGEALSMAVQILQSMAKTSRARNAKPEPPQSESEAAEKSDEKTESNSSEPEKGNHSMTRRSSPLKLPQCSYPIMINSKTASFNKQLADKNVIEKSGDNKTTKRLTFADARKEEEDNKRDSDREVRKLHNAAALTPNEKGDPNNFLGKGFHSEPAKPIQQYKGDAEALLPPAFERAVLIITEAFANLSAEDKKELKTIRPVDIVATIFYRCMFFMGLSATIEIEPDKVVLSVMNAAKECGVHIPRDIEDAMVKVMLDWHTSKPPPFPPFKTAETRRDHRDSRDSRDNRDNRDNNYDSRSRKRKGRK